MGRPIPKQSFVSGHRRHRGSMMHSHGCFLFATFLVRDDVVVMGGYWSVDVGVDVIPNARKRKGKEGEGKVK